MEMVGIGEIARQAGVAPSAIRYYERMGLLPVPSRVSGKRRYDLDMLRKLRVIRLAQHAGFTIAEIRTLLHEFPVNTPPSVRWQALAGHKITEIDAMMRQMQAMKTLLENTLQCACDTLEDCGGEIQQAAITPGC